MTRRGKEIAPPSEVRWYRVARSCATLLVVPLISSVASGCGGAFPVSEGKVLAIMNDDGILEKSDPGYDTTLQIRWLGSTCYLIQLGDAALLTDPFFSRHPLLQVALGEIASDPDIVSSKISALPIAEGIFIGHSHYDHMLDLAATLEQPGWQDVPVYGSITTRNLLCGYGEEVAANWTQAEADGQWHRFSEPVLDYKLEYMAVPSQHAPQVAGVLLNSGVVEDCLDHPPIRASDFKIGDPYTFVFRLSNDGAEFIVYFADSASAAIDPK